MVESRSKPPEFSTSTSGSNVAMNSTPTSTAVASEPVVPVSTAVRRPVRERLGPRMVDEKR